MDIILTPAEIGGIISIPSSKSHTIRALLIATFAEGESTIINPLISQDTYSCIEACKSLGALIERSNENSLRVIGVRIPDRITTIDCGNSGTTMYLAAAMASASSQKTTFTGDHQLIRRPVAALLDSLEALGVTVESQLGHYPPFSVQGPIKGGATSIECQTSQYLSALLLALPMAQGNSVITVPLLNERPYVEMTLHWLAKQHIQLEYDTKLSLIKVKGNQSYKPFEATIGGDYSSASFFFCAAAITGSPLTIQGLDPEDPQGDKEILTILHKMGCMIEWKDTSVTITGPARGSLAGGTFDLNTMPDALPILAVTACFAQGTTVLYNVPQARIKETDRITVMCNNLNKLGVVIEELPDGLIIHGQGYLTGGICDGYEDHRVIMAMAIASLGCSESVTIRGTDAVEVTFPTFFTLLDTIKHK